MKTVIVSGIQPTGDLHIGNFLGAVKNWVALQNEQSFERYFFVADWHSMTVDYDAAHKQKQIAQLVGDLLALGIDPKKSHLFVQSHIPEHAELAWIFNTLTPMSELEKMTQYKDKAARHATNINAGLFVYPVLQAADILMYRAGAVPVGEDQIQHVELARVIAKKFNSRFGRIFPEPRALLTPTPRVMSLLEPTKKMSKSHGEKSCIFLNDAPDVIFQKIRKAVTDQTGVKNLLALAKLFDTEELTYTHLLTDYKNGDLKNVELKDTLAELIAIAFKEFRATRDSVTESMVRDVIKNGDTSAREVAHETMARVREYAGLSRARA